MLFRNMDMGSLDAPLEDAPKALNGVRVMNATNPFFFVMINRTADIAAIAQFLVRTMFVARRRKGALNENNVFDLGLVGVVRVFCYSRKTCEYCRVSHDAKYLLFPVF